MPAGTAPCLQCALHVPERHCRMACGGLKMCLALVRAHSSRVTSCIHSRIFCNWAQQEDIPSQVVWISNQGLPLGILQNVSSWSESVQYRQCLSPWRASSGLTLRHTSRRRTGDGSTNGLSLMFNHFSLAWTIVEPGCAEWWRSPIPRVPTLNLSEETHHTPAIGVQC